MTDSTDGQINPKQIHIIQPPAANELTIDEVRFSIANPSSRKVTQDKLLIG